MLMPKDVEQLRSLLGGLLYYCKFLPNFAKRLQPLTVPAKKGAAFDYTSAMSSAVLECSQELTKPIV